MLVPRFMKFGIAVLALASAPGCGRLPAPTPAPASSEELGTVEAPAPGPRGDELETEVAADLAPRSEGRIWLEAGSKELEGERSALLRISVERPVTYLNVMLSFDPQQAEIRWVEHNGLVTPALRETGSGPGWKRFSVELTEPVQGEATLGYLGYVAQGTARTTAAPPFQVKAEFTGAPAVAAGAPSV